jgi:hypothetical protein
MIVLHARARFAARRTSDSIRNRARMAARVSLSKSIDVVAICYSFPDNALGGDIRRYQTHPFAQSNRQRRSWPSQNATPLRRFLMKKGLAFG